VTSNSDAERRARSFVEAAIGEYVSKRLSYYRERPGLLDDLLKKDTMLWALRGAKDTDDWVGFALAAHESSSEETMMGNAWQHILTTISSSAVGAGDLMVDRDDELWVIEMKSQTNTLNSASRAQTLKTLKRKLLEQASVRAPRRRGVRAMIGVLRGDPVDRTQTYRSTRPEDRDIDGFQYREMVGAPFRAWLTGIANPAALIGQTDTRGQTLAAAREECRSRLTAALRARLAAKGLPDNITSILDLSAGR
jgi:hypothetical protein